MEKRRSGTVARADKLRKSGLVVAVAPADPKALGFSLIATRGFVRKEKLTRIREQIRHGTYHVSAADVAKAILRSKEIA
jgi:anti-sigma28 factor (negative regulator of flagellin synthesis)